MALMIFEHFPEVNNVKGGLMFIAKNSFITSQYKREDKDKHWKTFENPNGLVRKFKLAAGCKFFADSDWHREGENDNHKIKRP